MSESRAKTYVGVLIALATTLVAAWSYQYGLEYEPSLAIGALAFATCILIGDLFPIRLSGRTNVGVWDVGMTVAVVVLGPTWAAIAALPSAFFVGRRDWLRTVYEVSHSIIIVYLAGIVFSFTSTPLLLGESGPTSQIVYGTFATGVVLLASNKVISAALLKIKYGQTFEETWNKLNVPYLFSDAICVLTSGLSVLALLKNSPFAAVVVVAGSIGSQVLVYRSREQLRENQKLQTRVASLEEALATSNMTFGAMIIQELGRKDGYIHRHAAATAVYAADLAREMRLEDTRAERLRLAGLLHNIGLFGLPEELLLATGKPNSIAQSQLAEHPARAEKALAAIPEFREMAGWVRWHHERPDGRGYPDKLRSKWIPLEAKILAVAQAYAAMILDKPHRPGVDYSEAREQLSRGVDTEFDGVVVRAFLRILDTESAGYRMADDHRFLFPTLEGRERTRPGAPGSEEGGVRSLSG